MLAKNWLPNRFQIYNVLFPILRSMGWLLGMYEEWTIVAGCIYVFHQLTTTVRPGLIGKGDSLLYKTVKNLYLAEGGNFCEPTGSNTEGSCSACAFIIQSLCTATQTICSLSSNVTRDNGRRNLKAPGVPSCMAHILNCEPAHA